MEAVSLEDGGTAFISDAWEKDPGEQLQGNGITQILENGIVFERAGCGFSHVRGPKLPPSATQHRPELNGSPFEAMGVSLVFHPRNPYVPTVHMNIRMIAATPSSGQTVAWFGGGMDLTPDLKPGVMIIFVSNTAQNKEVLEVFSLMTSQSSAKKEALRCLKA